MKKQEHSFYVVFIIRSCVSYAVDNRTFKNTVGTTASPRDWFRRFKPIFFKFFIIIIIGKQYFEQRVAIVC